MTTRTLVIVGVVVVVTLILFFGTATSELAVVGFDWNASQGFLSASIESKMHSALQRRLILIQSRPWISSYLKRQGWNSASGGAGVHVFRGILVLGVSDDGSIIKDPSETPLMKAAKEGDTGVVENFIKAGVDMNAKDQRGWTALIHAAIAGQAGTAEALLKSGADPNIKDKAGRTAFLWASWRCHADVAATLKASGADVSVRDRFGTSALDASPCVDKIQSVLHRQ